MNYLKNKKVTYAPIFDGYFYSSFHSLNSPYEFWKNEKILVDTITRSSDYFNPDIVMLEETIPDNNKIFGCNIDLSTGFVPLFMSSSINNKNDIENLKTFSKKGEKQKFIYTQLTKYFKKKGKLTTVAVKSPFETAFIMRGATDFMIDLKKDPKFIFEMLDKLLYCILPVIKDLKEYGIDIVTVKDSVASSSMISPVFYEKFVFPYEKKLNEEIKKYNMIPLLHICKNSNPIFQLMTQTGAEIIECDSINNIDKSINLLKTGQCIKGNIDSVSELEENFDNFSCNRLKILCNLSKDTNKLIISTGDSVTPETNYSDLLKLEKIVRNNISEN